MARSPSIFVSCLLLAIGALAVGAPVAYGQSFSSPINLSSTADWSKQQQIAASGSNVYVAWSDGAFGSEEILFKASTDGGSTFTAQTLSSPASGSLHPQIAVSGSHVYVVWQDGPAGQSKIFFRAIHDYGATFDPIQNLSATAPGYSQLPQIAASGSNVYVVWEEVLATGTEIFFMAIANNGGTFPVPQVLTNTGFPALPQVAAAGTNVYVAWEAGSGGITDVFFVRSMGAGFSAAQNLSANSGFSGNIRLAASDNNIYVVWQDDTPGNNEIFFRASADSGSTFNPPLNSVAKNVSNNSGFSGYPSIAVAQNNIYLVWLDTTNAAGDDDIFFSRSTDNGGTFPALPTNISNAPGLSNSPGSSQEQDGHKVVASGSFVYVIWQDENPAGPFDIFVRASTDNGASFGNAINLSANTSNSILPGIAASGCSVYAVWQDDGPANRDIFFTAAINSGGSGANLQGLGPALNLSNNSGVSSSQRMAASCSNVYVVWLDDTLGETHAFFSASYDNGATFFSTPIDLSPVYTKVTRQPAIAASGHNVYVAWSAFDTQTQNYEIFFRVSTNEGLKFAPAIQVSNSQSNPDDAEVAASGGNVYVAWHYNNIFLARSTNNGTNFDPLPTNLSTINLSGTNFNYAGENADAQKIAASGNNVFVAWRVLNHLLFTYSTDAGTSFAAVELSGNLGISAESAPQIAAAGSNVYLAWEGSALPHIYFLTSSGPGFSFGNFVDLSPGSASAVRPQMALSESNVYVAWVESTDSSYAHSDIVLRANNGAGFGNPINLSSNSLGNTSPQLVSQFLPWPPHRIRASGNNVYVTWRDATPGNYNIFFVVSNDGGAGFSNALNLSNNASPATDAIDIPEIAVSDPNVYVSWKDPANPQNNGTNPDIWRRAGIPPWAGVQSATSAGAVSFSTSAGGFSSMTAVSEASLPQAGKPQNVTFPYGFFNWTITGLAPPPPAPSVTVTITYPANIPVGAQYWKVIKGAWTQVLPPVLGSNNDGDKVLTLTITDGAPEDADGLVNGEISDPGGMALAVVPVTIDIKPGASPNSINPKDKGVVSVAILTTGAFNATTVDPATVRFGATGTEAAPVRSALRDVNKDKKPDLVLQFRVPDTAIRCGMTSAALTGKTKGGQPIKGADSLVTVGCP